MVSKARELFPDPDSPVKTISLSRGSSTLMLRRLCSRAPRTMSFPGSQRPTIAPGYQRTGVRFGIVSGPDDGVDEQFDGGLVVDRGGHLDEGPGRVAVGGGPPVDDGGPAGQLAPELDVDGQL